MKKTKQYPHPIGSYEEASHSQLMRSAKKSIRHKLIFLDSAYRFFVADRRRAARDSSGKVCR